MNVIIDKENMVFLLKSQDQASLSKLCDMQFPHVAISTVYCDHPRDFISFTDLELKLLIKNSMGPDVTNVYSRDALMQIVHSMLLQMPEVQINSLEVDFQWRTIQPGNKKRHVYVPGGYVPASGEGLAEIAGWKYSKGAANAVPAQASPASTAPRTARATPTANAMPAPSAKATGDFAMPKTGTSTHTIFMFCAERWKETGYSDDHTTLEGIRKQAVETLVPKGLNVSTVRTQAARWYQHRQQVVI